MILLLITYKFTSFFYICHSNLKIVYNIMNTNEELIVQKLRNGEQEAYQYLYKHHYIILCQFANELLNDPFLAETIVEDVIFHLWEIRKSLNVNKSLRAYLLKAVRNRCYNHLSSEKKKQEILFSEINIDQFQLNDMVPVEEQPLGRLLEQELEEKIIESINHLSDECKRVFWKSRFEHKKNDDIAIELNISVNTVKYHIKNALATLRRDLSKYLTVLITLGNLMK